jgi:hypothetical protein
MGHVVLVMSLNTGKRISGYPRVIGIQTRIISLIFIGVATSWQPLMKKRAGNPPVQFKTVFAKN